MSSEFFETFLKNPEFPECLVFLGHISADQKAVGVRGLLGAPEAETLEAAAVIGKNARVVAVVLMFAMTVATVGCASATFGFGPPPSNIAEYELALAGKATEYPIHTILLYNLQRTLDPDQPQEARMASLRLVGRLAGNPRNVRSYLGLALADPDLPSGLRKKLTEYLYRDSHNSIAVASGGLNVNADVNVDAKLQISDMKWGRYIAYLCSNQ